MKKIKQGNLQDTPKLVKPFKPRINLRKSDRLDLRGTASVNVLIHTQEDQKILVEKVFDLNSFGVGVIINNSPDYKLKPLQKLKLKIESNECEYPEYKSTLCWIEKISPQQLRLGIRIDDLSETAASESEDSNTFQLELPEQYPIIGYIYKDVLFFEKMAFYLKSISKTRIVIEIKHDTGLLFLGQDVKLILALQTRLGEVVKCRVTNIILDKNSNTQCHLAILRINKSVEEDIINHMLHNSKYSLKDIRSAGFSVKYVSNNFIFRFIKTQEEYQQVLNLRKVAYSDANKVSPDISSEQMIAPLDHMSRILAAFHHERIVASVSLSFPNTDTTLETEQSVESFPSFFPSKNKIIEVARLCTHSEYRYGDLLVRMFERIYQVLATSDRNFFVTSCDDNLWPLYKKIGFKDSKLRYSHPYLVGVNHRLIYANSTTGSNAIGISPLKWMYLYGASNRYLEKQLDKSSSVWTKVFRFLLRKMSKLIFRRRFQNY